jgi:hypothetical protein
MHLSCIKTNTISKKDRKEILHDPRHLGVPSGVSKMIFEPVVCLVQTVDLSCTETNTISKWTETRLYMTHVTYEFHRVRPKWFPRLRYVRRKPCTYHAPKLTLSPKGLKGDSSWPTSPRSSIGCVQKWFLRLWYVWCKLWTYLAPRLTLCLNRPKQDSTWPRSPRSSIGWVQNDFRAYGTFGANRVTILNQD